MKTIALTQGKASLVDDADYEWLSKWKWFAHRGCDGKTWYAERHAKDVDGKDRTIRMHRQILGLEYGDKKECDHIDHNGLNNCRANLRRVRTCENQWNQFGRKGYYRSDDGRYRVQIHVDGARKRLGCYNTPIEARAVYLAAKAKYHKIAGQPACVA